MCMCRLLGYVAPRACSVQDAVGGPTLAAFRALARIHGDGWGAAWLPERGEERIGVCRSTASAADDPGFAAVARSLRSRAAFVHLRWATEGIAVTAANTHPFVADGWAFAHNGFVRSSEALLPLLSHRHRTALRGSTDSERYFRLVLHHAERAGDIVGGLQRAAAVIRDSSAPVSINAMLLAPGRLLAVQGLAGARPPRDDLLAKVAHPDHLPQDHLDGYFRLCRRRVGDALAVVSSGLPRDGWTELAPDSVLDVDVASGAGRTHPLLDDAPDRLPDPLPDVAPGPLPDAAPGRLPGPPVRAPAVEPGRG